MAQSDYILHYAPDNASLVIRLALEEIGARYITRLVDRRTNAQQSPAFLALNPNGLIPVLETPDGPIYETAAILLWLADRHGGLAPGPAQAERGELLKWLFFLSNCIHPALRCLFYPSKFIGSDPAHQAQLAKVTQARISDDLLRLDVRWQQERPGLMLDLYLGPMLRWLALYPTGADYRWYRLKNYPALWHAACALEARPSVHAAQAAEGLGPTPFTAPHAPTPSEGSAT